MIKYMAVAVAVVASGGVAVPAAVPVADLTKSFFIKMISESMFGVIKEKRSDATDFFKSSNERNDPKVFKK